MLIPWKKFSFLFMHTV